MNDTPKLHSAWQSLAFHLLPGAFITVVYFAIAPAVTAAGFPPLFALLLSILVVLLPVELAILYFEGYRLNGRLSLQGIVLNRQPIPLWQYFVIVLILFIWLGLAFTQLGPVDDFLARMIFPWVPVWAMPAALAVDVGRYSHTALLWTAVLGLLLNGILGPAVEEFYFRGFLLPRIPASRGWAPLINAVLFSLYHFFSPWQNVTRIVGLIPLVYAVSWKRNLYLSMFTHILGNTVGMVGLLAAILH
jgi:membrane protease YdiL (CAAX protease family)